MIGETVGHYRIVERLGGGGMGVVYRAEDTHLGRSVALKFLPAELSRDPTARERFKLEARAASALDHANICTIHDIDETPDGRLFIAMAWYEGRTLEARLADGPLDVDEAVEIARQVAAGLERAHEGGIVHRDIKPANLMITRRGDVRILDFGVARLAGEAGLTRTGETVGTLAYMAPEQVEGAEPTPATDLWALGVVLYEMTTGTLPFAGAEARQTVTAILARDPEPPGARRAELPPELDALTLDLLAKAPGDRPESAAGVRRRLEALAAPAGPATPLLRRPAVWAGIAVAALLLAIALVVPARNRARIDEARALLPRIERLAGEGRYVTAYRLAERGERVLGEDTALARLWPEIADVVTIRTAPPGARVSLHPFTRGAGEGDPGGGAESGEAETGRGARSDGEPPLEPGEPTVVDTTPVVDLRVPRDDHYVSIEKEGYAAVERVVSSGLPRVEAAAMGTEPDLELDVALLPADSVPEGTVFVPGGEYTLVSADAPAGASADLGSFFIDRFEVTNADYLEFVRAGGYGDPELQDYRDRTGLPGPRNWVGGRFPGGEDRHPVTGVSWHEAAAYCAFRGGALPTIFEWEKAAREGAYTPAEGITFPWGIVRRGEPTERRANFGGSGTTDVAAYPFGLSPWGAYGMAGNVREWTATVAEEGFIAMGGSWRDPPYVFPSIATPAGSSASPALGFRCVRRSVPAERQGARRLALERRSPSYEPVDRATFRSFLSYYRYDPVELDPEVVEAAEEEDWRRIKVRMNGVGDDVLLAYLYLPRAASPPYQTLVYVPGAHAFFGSPLDEQLEWLLGPNIRSGRAALAVVMDGMVERPRPPAETFPATESVAFRELMVKHATELRLGLDYLESRDDIDMERLAYVGLSWGAGSRALFAAVDPRFDAVIFVGAGIDERVQPTVPEALNVNFIPYIDVPTLMLNGRQDEEHPWLTRALPFWELLTEPKELVLVENEGHSPSLETRVPAINGFLDRVLGPVR